MPETLDFALKARLRAVLDDRSVTESVLRKLTEQVYRQLGVSNRTQAAMYWIVAAPATMADGPRRPSDADAAGC